MFTTAIYGNANPVLLHLLNNEEIAEKIFYGRLLGKKVQLGETVSSLLSQFGILVQSSTPGFGVSEIIKAIPKERIATMERELDKELLSYRHKAYGLVKKYKNNSAFTSERNRITERGFNIYPLIFMGLIADLRINDIVYGYFPQFHFFDGREILITDYSDLCRPEEWYGVQIRATEKYEAIFLWDMAPDGQDCNRQLTRVLSHIAGDEKVSVPPYLTIDKDLAMLLDQIAEDCRGIAECVVSAIQKMIDKGHAGLPIMVSVVIPRLFMKHMPGVLRELGCLWRPWCRVAISENLQISTRIRKE